MAVISSQPDFSLPTVQNLFLYSLSSSLQEGGSNRVIIGTSIFDPLVTFLLCSNLGLSRLYSGDLYLLLPLFFPVKRTFAVFMPR